MCIDLCFIKLCSSCFYTSKPLAKPSHKVQPDILSGQPVIQLELAAPKALPMTSSCCVVTTEVHVPDVNKADVVVQLLTLTLRLMVRYSSCHLIRPLHSAQHYRLSAVKP